MGNYAENEKAYFITLRPSDRLLKKYGVTARQYVECVSNLLDLTNKVLFFCIEETGKTNRSHYHGFTRGNYTRREFREYIKAAEKYFWILEGKQGSPPGRGMSVLIRDIGDRELDKKEVIYYMHKECKWKIEPHINFFGDLDYYNQIMEQYIY